MSRGDIDIKTTLWRAVDPEYSRRPLNAIGSMVCGGRLNAPGTPAIYLASDPMTAMLEVAPKGGLRKAAQTLIPVEVDLTLICDLTDKDACAKYNVDVVEMMGDWSTDKAEPSYGQKLRDKLLNENFVGAKYQSFANPYLHNFVIWKFRKPQLRIEQDSGHPIWLLETFMGGNIRYICLSEKIDKRFGDEFKECDDFLDEAVAWLSQKPINHQNFEKGSDGILQFANQFPDAKILNDTSEFYKQIQDCLKT